MLKTVEECVARLGEIESETNRFNLELEMLSIEKTYVERMMELFEKRSNPTTPKPNGNGKKRTDQVLAIIQNNPGINGRDIREQMPKGTTQVQVTNALSSLREHGFIENRGKTGLAAKWRIKK